MKMMITMMIMITKIMNCDNLNDIDYNDRIFSYFYSTTKHEIIQIKNHNLLCSLDPPNQSRLF